VLTLYTNVKLSKCDTSLSPVKMSWTIYSNNDEIQSDIQSTSKNSRILVLPSYSLQIGKIYEIVFSASKNCATRK
jgi:hypothetical protein